ncbi:hypothetical protein D1BOALGB6SA_6642 [Olavius sp. associated proteobacterium Delta 1]|nr:hypothetical protein D1BOALGB6SA_6642 [Olavius sp. associated proteobacterium Delta 1]
MAPQVMRSEMYTNYITCLGHHLSCSLITYRKNALMRFSSSLSYLIFKPICESLRYEDKFLFSPTFRIPETPQFWKPTSNISSL